MVSAGDGSIANVPLTAAGALTSVVGYSAAKADVENLTRWLAVELAPPRYRAGLRINPTAPGFFLGEQNRAVPVREDRAPTARAGGRS